MSDATYIKYLFREHTGYLIDPRQGAEQSHVAIGHSAAVAPWADSHIHFHESSAEFFFLRTGTLHFLVDDCLLTLQANEILMVKHHIPHAIVGGEGAIEHFGLRAPALLDKQVVGPVPTTLPAIQKENRRELRANWGYRIPLNKKSNQNCWVLGVGKAQFESPHLALAYVNFPTVDQANQSLGTRYRNHLHRQSWEIYAVFAGTQVILIEDELLTLRAGELLTIPPGIKHTLVARQAPYAGFTLRAPILDDKVMY